MLLNAEVLRRSIINQCVYDSVYESVYDFVYSPLSGNGLSVC